MPGWAKTFVLVIGTLSWVSIVAVSLRLEQIPSAMIVGFLPALWLALSGRSSVAREDPAEELAEEEGSV